MRSQETSVQVLAPKSQDSQRPVTPASRDQTFFWGLLGHSTHRHNPPPTHTKPHTSCFKRNLLEIRNFGNVTAHILYKIHSRRFRQCICFCLSSLNAYYRSMSIQSFNIIQGKLKLFLCTLVDFPPHMTEAKKLIPHCSPLFISF